MSGAPSLDLTRTVRTVVSGRVTVVETVLTPLRATAEPPEAEGSTTRRPDPETLIASASIVTGVVGVVATAPARAADNLSASNARSRWRQKTPANTAAAASAGTVGAEPGLGVKSDVRMLPRASDTEALATGGEVIATGSDADSMSIRNVSARDQATIGWSEAIPDDGNLTTRD